MLERLIPDIDPEVSSILDASLSGTEMSVAQAERLLRTQGADFHALLMAADHARREDCGDDVSFVICRNLNFTNVCYVGCTFCGFARHKQDVDAYDHSMDTMLEKVADGVARGATEICIQGGIHPKKDHTHYAEILRGIKREFPKIHLHAFSPEEIDWGHRKSGMPLDEYFAYLIDAGLGSTPGTAAEILDDEIRRKLSPRKLMTDRWVEIIQAAHAAGLPSTSTVMYGHIEHPGHVARHLGLLRDIQKRTGGFSEFVPLGYIHERNTLYNELGARAGSSMNEDLRMIAVARLFFRPWITNIQVSWVKMGYKLGQMALESGANDFGGTLMEESISRESGADHGENCPPEEFRRLIREVGRIPVQRNTVYGTVARFEDPEKDPPSMEPEALRDVRAPIRSALVQIAS